MALEAFGPVRYCLDCCLQSRDDNPQQRWWKDKVIQAIRELRDAFDTILRQRSSYISISYVDGSKNTIGAWALW